MVHEEMRGAAQDGMGKAGRLTFPIAMLAYPFYLWKRSPGKEGSHYDPKCDLFTPAEEPLVSSNLFCALLAESSCNSTKLMELLLSVHFMTEPLLEPDWTVLHSMKV